MKRQLQPRKTEQELAIQASEIELTSDQMAAYLRQSSTKQVENNLESADLQLSGALRYAVQQGLDSDKIVVAHEGDGVKGVSGTLRIDQREKLQEIMADIALGKIKLLWAYSVSRLFRDRYGVQVGTFIETCAKYHVRVVIETASTFDFNNSMDVMIFQVLANVASKESDDRTKLLSSARRQKALRGEYDGRPLMAGYIVDRNKNSATYGHFIVYAPHAKVVQRLYKRYRELSGRFNLLASEVAQMPVVFPEFEQWVDALDISRLQLKKVNGGYHISRMGLYNLLVAIEYQGYWKVKGTLLVDSDNNLLVTHEPIVDTSDWNYAFTRLSWNNLDGSNNTKRIDGKEGWVQSDKKSSSILQGILTSKQGNVRYSNGIYNIAELRPGHSQWSNTLSMRYDMIDALFMARMAERVVEMYDTGNTEFIQEQLAQTKVNNARALVSVDEQIKVATNKIKGIRAYIKATGATASTATLQEYNADLLGLDATIAELQQKKLDASVEESSLTELAQEIKNRQGLYNSERFIRLACESVSLDEYSQHFVTLTINWREPFQQTDVCYIYRGDGGKVEWSKADTDDLRALYPHADRLAILQRFPARSWLCIMSYAYQLGITRYTRLNTSGITNRVLSLKDHNLLSSNGWELGTDRDYYWLYAVNTSDSLSVSGRYW